MNLRRLFAMAFKEVLQVWRDPRSLALALLMPVMQMVLLGYGVSLDIKRVPLCIYDQENGQLSRALVQHFIASGWFSAVRALGSDRAVRDAMDRAACIGAVVIPVDFTRVLTTTGTARLQTVFDATDSNTANIAIGYAQGVIAKATADFESGWGRRQGTPGQTVDAVDLEPRIWFNEGLESRNYIIPGVVAVILSLIGAQLSSLTISREWERGTMEQLISSPASALEVMIGKLVPYFAIGLFDAAFCLLSARYWFGVPFSGSVSTLFVTTALFTLVVLGIGYLLSVRIRSQLGASQVAITLTMLPTTMLSGYTFAIDQMPAPVQAVTLLVYARYYVTILRSIYLKGTPLAELGLPVLALALYAAAILWIAARAFRKRLD
jgi:ABC-2 type transport system permease protein